MKLGYSVTSTYPRAVSPSTAATTLLERATVARRVGFDYVQVGDHRVLPGHHYLQNVPVAARLTELFDRVAVMTLLPLTDPLVFATQLGTIDAFVDELDLWCGLGYREADFAAAGVPRGERVPRFEEALALCRALWADDDVTFDGQFYEANDVSISPKADPVRVCIGASVEAGIRRAGRLGDAWVTLSTETKADIEQKSPWFHESGGDEVVLRRDALVLEDHEAACSAAESLLAEGYRGWGPGAPVLYGDVASVSADLKQFRELGVDEVVVRPMSAEYGAETLREFSRARDLL